MWYGLNMHWCIMINAASLDRIDMNECLPSSLYLLVFVPSCLFCIVPIHFNLWSLLFSFFTCHVFSLSSLVELPLHSSLVNLTLNEENIMVKLE